MQTSGPWNFMICFAAVVEVGIKSENATQMLYHPILRQVHRMTPRPAKNDTEHYTKPIPYIC